MSEYVNSLWSVLTAGVALGLNLWRPMLEIGILTFAIYYALRFLRGTRGAPIVTGFVFLLVAFVLVTYLLKLKVLQYLLGAFSAFFALAVLVLFQPELR